MYICVRSPRALFRFSSHAAALYSRGGKRAFRTSPQQTGLKIMTLWLCLSFAALCLPLRSCSLNTHSAEATVQLWAVCMPPYFLKISKSLIDLAPVSLRCMRSLHCHFQNKTCVSVNVLFSPALEALKKKIKQRAGCKQWEKCAKLLLLLACNDIISPRDREQRS